MSKKTEKAAEAAVTVNEAAEAAEVRAEPAAPVEREAENGDPTENQHSVFGGERTSSEANETYPQGETRDAELVRTRPQVYCGPTVRGVVKQYTVYCDGIPAALEAFIEAHPAARALLVSVERFAETRKRMETAGTAEAILYQKIKSEL